MPFGIHQKVLLKVLSGLLIKYVLIRTSELEKMSGQRFALTQSSTNHQSSANVSGVGALFFNDKNSNYSIDSYKALDHPL